MGQPVEQRTRSPEEFAAALVAVEYAVGAIGGKWKLLILFHLAAGPRRYGELRRRIPQITEKMLIQQLRELEADQLVARTVLPAVPPHVEYSMTDAARALCPVIDGLFQWGAAQLAVRG